MTEKKKGLQNSINGYISKLKKMPSTLSHLSTTPTSSPSRFLAICNKHPRTPSFAAAAADDNAGATLSDVDRFLRENFHSLYSHGGGSKDDDDLSNDSRCYDTDPPSPAVIRKSDRFFVSPGTSGSLEEITGDHPTASSDSSSPPSPGSSCRKAEGPGGGVAVVTLSKDPYKDFRRSMQEMADINHVDPRQPLDWDFMEELLLCFLDHNDRGVHKYILRAFTDLTVSFSRREDVGGRRVPARTRRSSISGQRRFPAVQKTFRKEKPKN